MGNQNVGLVFARWGHLPAPSFRLLLFLAHRCRDEDDPPTYWDTRESLVFGLSGRHTPDEPADDDRSNRAEDYRRIREADFRALRRAFKSLTQPGVVDILRRPSKGRNTVYSLHLDAAGGGSNGGRFMVATEDVSWSDGGRIVVGDRTENVHRHGGVRGGQVSREEPQNQEPNPNSAQSLGSPAAVDNSASTHDDAEELELSYANARTILERLPDLGMSLIAGLTEIEGMRNRVIAAAALAVTADPTLNRSAS